MLKYAEETGKHNHEEPNDPRFATLSNPKAKPSINSADLLKDVTKDVELITNDRDSTAMFLNNYKFTSYYESKTNAR